MLDALVRELPVPFAYRCPKVRLFVRLRVTLTPVLRESSLLFEKVGVPKAKHKPSPDDAHFEGGWLRDSRFTH